MNSQIETLDTPEPGMHDEAADLAGFANAENVQDHRGLIESASFVVSRAIDAIGAIGDKIPKPSRRLTASLATLAIGVSGGGLATSAAAQTTGGKRATSAQFDPGHVLKTYEALTPLPHTSTAQAIADLNKQRIANGMLPVAESSAFDAFCQKYISGGQVKKNFASSDTSSQNTSQIGASSVDWISGGAGGGAPGNWNSKVNPWSNTPDVLDTIFDPIMTQTGYAETKKQWGFGQGCIETFGDRQWATPTFYSLPGNGMTTLPWETAEPTNKGYTPGAAVGIPTGTKTGPNILLWPEGDVGASVQSASLTGPNGPVGVKIVRPGMPFPPKLGGTITSHANYVIPKPLKPSSNYILDANWVDPGGASHPQEVKFKTDTADAANNPHPICDGCPHGHFDLKTKGDKVRVELSPAAGQKVTLRMSLGHMVCVLNQRPCPPGGELNINDRIVTDTIKHYRKPVTFRLPHRTSAGSNLMVTATTNNFTAEGYQWAAINSIGKSMKAPR